MELSGHVIVCGLNNLGFRIAEQLHHSAMPVVVVDDTDSPAMRRQLERWGVPFIRESAHSAEALAEAGIAKAVALVACHDQDLQNLETSLLTAEIAPDLRVVVRFANPQLSEQLSAALPGIRVLSLSEKAGPSFVEACIRSDVLHAFEMAGETFQVADIPVTGYGAFRQVYGNLTPVSLRRPGERLAEMCPGRDTPLTPGDRLALLGRVEDFHENGLRARGEETTAVLAALSSPHDAEQSARSRRRSARERVRGLMATIGGELDRPFRLALLAVLTIILISTLVLSEFYRSNTRGAPAKFDMLDGLYLTVETMVTVGYGDYNFGNADHWLQVFGIFLMLSGALSIAVVYAFITNVIISRRLERALGRGRATAIRDHVIVCGLGSVGLATMEGLLSAGRPVVVIERDENNRYLPVARELGVPVIVGDATVRTTLLEAGLDRAVTLAALTSDDVANLETVLSAREAFADAQAKTGKDARELRVVLRIFDTQLAEEVERRFDIHTARSASALATPYFVGAALDYEVLSTFYVDSTLFIITRMIVAAGGDLDGPTLKELSTGARVIAVGTVAGDGGHEARPNYWPTRHTRLTPGEQLLVVGPYTQVIEMVKRNRRVDVGHPVDR